MCYSGKCDFENMLGECIIHDYTKFEKEYSYSPCLIGGMIQNSDDAIFYISHKFELEQLKEQYFNQR